MKLILFYKDQIILTNKHQFIDFEAVSVFFVKNNLDVLKFDNKYYLAEITENDFLNILDAYSNLLFCSSLRSVILNFDLIVDQEKIKIITKARQLAHWNTDHNYCGRCGATTVKMDAEYAKECTNCHLICYPKINPCILAAVVRDGQILLGRSPHFPAGVYSLLAGFIEVGETAEETVVREVFEETHVQVKNIRYFGSQPWPFPHSLMLAYVADYAFGEIIVDKNELEDAKWFDYTNLQSNLKILPAKGSLSRKLLDELILSRLESDS